MFSHSFFRVGKTGALQLQQLFRFKRTGRAGGIALGGAFIVSVFTYSLPGFSAVSGAPLSVIFVDGSAHSAMHLIADAKQPVKKGNAKIYYGNTVKKNTNTPSNTNPDTDEGVGSNSAPEQPQQRKRDNPDGLSQEEMAERAARHKKEALFESDYISDDY